MTTRLRKTPAELDADIAAFLAKKRPNERRFVVLDDLDDGQAIGRATVAQLREYAARGTVDGSRDKSIAERYNDKHDNDVAESLTPAEAKLIISEIEKG